MLRTHNRCRVSHRTGLFSYAILILLAGLIVIVDGSLSVAPYCDSTRHSSKETAGFCAMTTDDILRLDHDDAHRLLLSLHRQCDLDGDRDNIGRQIIDSEVNADAAAHVVGVQEAIDRNVIDADFYKVGSMKELEKYPVTQTTRDAHDKAPLAGLGRGVSSPASVLMGIYANMDGPNWKNNTHWGDTSVCYCEWYGIVCAPCGPGYCQMGYCMVVALNLGENRLSGDYHSIDPYLQQIPYLTYLVLNDNSITGTIASFSNMGLQGVVLNGNQLSGTLPEINLPLLEKFVIHENSFSGTLPPFAMSSKLSVLSAFDNEFEGQIPDYSIPSLNVIAVHLNKLSGTLPSFQNCPYLIILSVQNNTIEGTIPKYSHIMLDTLSAFHNMLVGDVPELGCPSLKTLALHDNWLYGTLGGFKPNPLLEIVSLSGNQLVGTIPSYTLNKLHTLSVGSNRFTGSIPPPEQHITLSVLSLSDNQISGTLPDFTKLPFLTVIDIGNNDITGTISNPIGGAYLGAFLVPYNRLTGTIPNLVGSPYLSYLMVSNNKLNGTIPAFNHVPFLSLLSVIGNPITGTLSEFNNTPYLKNLLLAQTSISGTIPDFKNMMVLENLLIYDMQVHGTIPDLQLPSLQMLYIVRNSISGTIPDFTYLKNIKLINIVYLKLEGTIPDFKNIPTLNQLYVADLLICGTVPDFKYLPNLDSIYVLSVNITGTVPNFTNLPKLRYLRLHQTKLSGTIPDFDNLPNLEVLSLYQTNVGGTIPNFKNLPNIKTLEIHQMKLRGSLPEFTRCSKLAKLTAFNNELSGTIPNWVLPNLFYLDIGHNLLTGSLPSFMGMPGLKSFIIRYNNIEGIIPQSALVLTRLQEFVANNNKLRGKTPPFFLQLPEFINFDMSSNEIEESIFSFLVPVTQEDVTSNLYFLQLQNNKLSGPLHYYIPYLLNKAREVNIANNNIDGLQELVMFSGWERLNVSGNPISGSIPETFSYFSNLEILDISGTELKSTSNNAYIPRFLKESNRFEKNNELDNYYCPYIVGKSNPELIAYMDPTYYNNTFCQCLPNYYGVGSQCVHCDNPCECSGGTHLKGCYASTDGEKTVELLICPYKTACNPNNEEIFECKNGHTGRLCSRCKSGFQQQGRKCAECPYYAKAVVLTLFPLGLAMLLWYLITTPPKNTGVIKIFLFHMQTLSILSSTILDLGNGMNSFVDTAFVSSSFMLPALNCVIEGISTETTIMAYLLRFPIVLAFGGIARKLVPGKNKNKVVFVSAFCIYAIYYGISRVTFGALGCTLHDPGSDHWFLNMYPWIQCRPSTGEFDNLLAMAILFLVVFVIGLPVWTYFHLKKLSEKFGNEDVEDSYGFLYLPYRKECYQWECVVLLRRMFFSLVITVVPYSQPTLLFFLLYVIIQISIWLQESYKPYVLERENRLEIASLYVIYFSFFAGLLSTLLNISEWLILLVLIFNVVVAAFISIVYIIAPGARSFWSSLSTPKAVENVGQNYPMSAISPSTGSPSSWVSPEHDPGQKAAPLNLSVIKVAPGKSA